jgi:hypothetical protein
MCSPVRILVATQDRSSLAHSLNCGVIENSVLDCRPTGILEHNGETYWDLRHSPFRAVSLSTSKYPHPREPSICGGALIFGGLSRRRPRRGTIGCHKKSVHRNVPLLAYAAAWTLSRDSEWVPCADAVADAIGADAPKRDYSKTDPKIRVAISFVKRALRHAPDRLVASTPW